jgi:hypothetical protein
VAAPATSTPRPLRAAALIVLAEGLALLVVSVIYTYRAATGHPGDRGTALFGAALGLLAALLLCALAAGIDRVRRAALTPATMAQLLALPVAWGFFRAGQEAAAACVAIPAVVVLVLLFGSAAARDAFR